MTGFSHQSFYPSHCPSGPLFPHIIRSPLLLYYFSLTTVRLLRKKRGRRAGKTGRIGDTWEKNTIKGKEGVENGEKGDGGKNGGGVLAKKYKRRD
jgi:hypothetical protein